VKERRRVVKRKRLRNKEVEDNSGIQNSRVGDYFVDVFGEFSDVGFR
jgi:hypothetical protein